MEEIRVDRLKRLASRIGEIYEAGGVTRTLAETVIGELLRDGLPPDFLPLDTFTTGAHRETMVTKAVKTVCDDARRRNLTRIAFEAELLERFQHAAEEAEGRLDEAPRTPERLAEVEQRVRSRLQKLRASTTAAQTTQGVHSGTTPFASPEIVAEAVQKFKERHYSKKRKHDEEDREQGAGDTAEEVLAAEVAGAEDVGAGDGEEEEEEVDPVAALEERNHVQVEIDLEEVYDIDPASVADEV